MSLYLKTPSQLFTLALGSIHWQGEALLGVKEILVFAQNIMLGAGKIFSRHSLGCISCHFNRESSLYRPCVLREKNVDTPNSW